MGEALKALWLTEEPLDLLQHLHRVRADEFVRSERDVKELAEVRVHVLHTALSILKQHCDF